MAYNTLSIKKDAEGQPIPQYFNELENEYQVAQGIDGLAKVIYCNGLGEPLDTIVIQQSINNFTNMFSNKLDELIQAVI